MNTLGGRTIGACSPRAAAQQPGPRHARHARPWQGHWQRKAGRPAPHPAPVIIHRGRLLQAQGLLGALLRGTSSRQPDQQQLGATGPSLEDDLGDLSNEEAEVSLGVTQQLDGSSSSIVFSCSRHVEAAELEQLCTKVGWPPRPVHKLEAALRNSFMVSSLILRTSRPGSPTTYSEALIGAARATGDHVFNATIWDVVVHPDYQGQGLGKALLEQTVRALLRRDIKNITLFSDAKAVDFYRQLDFEADPEGIKGMFWLQK